MLFLPPPRRTSGPVRTYFRRRDAFALALDSSLAFFRALVKNDLSFGDSSTIQSMNGWLY